MTIRYKLSNFIKAELDKKTEYKAFTNVVSRYVDM